MNTHDANDVDALKAQVRDLKLALRQDDTNLMLRFKLTPAASNLFGLLLSVNVVTPEIVERRLEIATDTKVAIHRLRQQLKAWDIQVHGRRGLGYWLEPETKARIKGLLSEPSEVFEVPAEPEAPAAQAAA